MYFDEQFLLKISALHCDKRAPRPLLYQTRREIAQLGHLRTAPLTLKSAGKQRLRYEAKPLTLTHKFTNIQANQFKRIARIKKPLYPPPI